MIEGRLSSTGKANGGARPKAIGRRGILWYESWREESVD